MMKSYRRSGDQITKKNKLSIINVNAYLSTPSTSPLTTLSSRTLGDNSAEVSPAESVPLTETAAASSPLTNDSRDTDIVRTNNTKVKINDTNLVILAVVF